MAICWWLVEIGSQCLDREERDAVRGDLEEAGATGGDALRQVWGLVFRRQAALWWDWRPLLVLATVVVPMGMLLSHTARGFADGNAVYAFLYIDNWTWAYIESPGARRDLATFSTAFFLNALTLAGWSWATGYVLGSLSRRTVWVTASLFFGLAVYGAAGSATTARFNKFNGAVFSLPFYRVVFPLLVQATCVVLPVVWGIRRSLRHRPLHWPGTAAGVAMLAMLTPGLGRTVEYSILFGLGVVSIDPGLDGVVGTADDPRFLRFLLSLVLMWPALYLGVSEGVSRWHRPAASPGSNS
jgi:hypothetical protein